MTETHILLGKKLRGFGEGIWNGPGGKLEPEDDGNIFRSASRELKEECGITAPPENFEHVAHHTFYIGGKHVFDCDVFILRKWDGKPKDSEELELEWFPIAGPWPEPMWPDDKIWLARVLAGEKMRCNFWLSEDGKQVESHNIAPF